MAIMKRLTDRIERGGYPMEYVNKEAAVETVASIASWISLGTDVTAGAHGLWGGYNHKWRETAQTTSQDERQTRAFRRSIAYIAALTTAKYVFSDISESLEPAIEAGKTAAWGLGGLLLPYAGRVIGKVGYAIWNALPSPDKN